MFGLRYTAFQITMSLPSSQKCRIEGWRRDLERPGCHHSISDTESCEV